MRDNARTAPQGNPNMEDTPPTTPKKAINGYGDIQREDTFKPEPLRVEVLKDGGRVTVENMPYGRPGAQTDRELLQDLTFDFLSAAKRINPRFLTQLAVDSARGEPKKKIFYFQPEFKRGSLTPNPFHDIIPGWTNVHHSGALITATAEDSCAALIHAADTMACYTDVVITLKCPDGSTSVRSQLRRPHARSVLLRPLLSPVVMHASLCMCPCSQVVTLAELRAAGVKTYPPPPVRGSSSSGTKRDLDMMAADKQAAEAELEKVKAELEAMKKKVLPLSGTGPVWRMA